MCDVCSEAVTNPICPYCLAEAISAWLTLYPNLREELMPKLKNYLNKISGRLLNYTICIKCKSKRAMVCPYCFTEFVLRELKKLNVSPMVLKEFFEFFNFDLHHTGYSNEAYELGVF